MIPAPFCAKMNFIPLGLIAGSPLLAAVLRTNVPFITSAALAALTPLVCTLYLFLPVASDKKRTKAR